MAKAILKMKESQVGELTIVIPKIRDYHKSFSSIVITYDNGDTRVLLGDNLNRITEELDKAIEDYYADKK